MIRGGTLLTDWEEKSRNNGEYEENNQHSSRKTCSSRAQKQHQDLKGLNRFKICGSKFCWRWL